ncbi:MAG: acetylxylan esterase [Verrucomicrobiae bacterium]|nr:acetylxylan esterase [Verrucomicrobiae bacterium]
MISKNDKGKGPCAAKTLRIPKKHVLLVEQTIKILELVIALIMVLRLSSGVCAETATAETKAANPIIAREKSSAADVNLAKGKPYTLDPAPNYGLCLDADDLRQLTDGVIYNGAEMFWGQKTTVGWKNVSQALITVDLGKVEPLGEATFRTAFDGLRNVRWPRSIKVFVSEDGKEFFLAGEMINPTWPEELPPELAPFGNKQRQVCHRYSVRLDTRGRYVCFAEQSPKFFFCDEVEVFRGPDALLEKPAAGKKTGAVKEYLKNSTVRDNVSGVLLKDLDHLRRAAADLPVEEKTRLSEKLAQLKARTDAMEFQCLTDETRAITPLNDIHRDILRIHAEILRLKKYPPLMVWHKNRWDPLEAMETPSAPPPEPPSLVMEMMDYEYRAEAVNLTNAGAEDLDLEISFDGLPGGTAPDYLTVQQVEFVGAQEGKMIADPLVAAGKSGKGYRVIIPSGMTRQLWLTFNPRGIKAGSHQGFLLASGNQRHLLKIPLNFVLHPFRFPDQPRLSLTMWDYTDRPFSFKSATEQNVPLAIKDMREHFVDTAYGQRKSACWPEKGDFDTEGNLVKPLRTGGFDDWAARWKGVRRFHIYTGNMLKDFCGEPMGTPRFERMVGQWAAAFAKHAQTRGVKPEQIAMHLYDEPSKDEHCKINTVWGKAIKAGAPQMLLFTDASSFKNSTAAFKEMIGVHDILCPSLPDVGGITAVVREAAAAEKNKSRRFWLYSSYGPSRLFDPYYYHRLQAWHCWRDGAEGMGFWNYWNYYRTENCAAWNEFATPEESYGVSYTTADTVTAGKHWEAIREGVEDYEYLQMLSTRVEELGKKGITSDALRKAKQLLQVLPTEVAGQFDWDVVRWASDKNRLAADQARIRILKVLDQLASGENATAKRDPAKENILTVKTDRPEALYRCGERAGFQITANVPEEPFNECPVTVRLSLDGGKIIETQSLKLAQSPLRVTGALTEPGFLRCAVSYVKNKKTYTVCASAGFEPDRIKTTAVMPEDFDAFWNNGRAELAKIPLDMKMSPLSKFSNEKQDCFLISFANLDNTRLHGFLSIPKQAKPPYPAYLTVQPAGQNPSIPSGCEWGAKGVLALHLGIHNYEVGLPPEESIRLYEEINRLVPCMYMYIGAPDRHRAYFRRVILGIDRAIEYLTSRPDFDGKHLAACGSSQGGGLSLIMAGLNRRITAVAANVPALCDLSGSLADRQAGWPPLLIRGATAEEKAPYLKMSAYFDTVNFARKIECPAIVSVGFADTTCPPSSVYSAYNEIRPPKEIFQDPLAKHDAIKPFYAFLTKWLEGQLGLGNPVHPMNP